jgi:D-glycero-alpha-D-manno-heptose-7-phosphate kinase
MTGRPVFLGETLTSFPVESSAPCRIDCGGTLDIKAVALPLQGFKPATVNFALQMRTHVQLKPYKADWIKVRSSGFADEEYRLGEARFDTPLGYFFAIASFFRVHGVQIVIHSESPVKSALGGSSAAGVAVIYALSKALEKRGQRRLTKKETVLLAYNLEDGVSLSFCGLQDHAAACYGGVNKWVWGYHPVENQFRQTELIAQNACDDLSRHLLIAYSGESHNSVEINLKWVNEFLNGKHRKEWIEVIQHVNEFAAALGKRNWKQAAEALKNEMAIRRTITPEAMIPLTDELLAAADEAGCGARFAGAGGGGCCWAIGELKDIDKLRNDWQQILEKSGQGRLLSNRIATQGVV